MTSNVGSHPGICHVQNERNEAMNKRTTVMLVTMLLCSLLSAGIAFWQVPLPTRATRSPGGRWTPAGASAPAGATH